MSKIDSSLFQMSPESIRHAFGDCPECGSALHILNGKKGKFLGCTSYPACHFSQALQKQSTVITLKVMDDSHCPECGNALAVKKGRYGMFIGCTNFPDCHYIVHEHDEKEVAESVNCPACHKGKLLERHNKTGKRFYSCDQYPKCKYLVNDEPVEKSCPQCQHGILVKKHADNGDFLICPQQDCDYQRPFSQ